VPNEGRITIKGTKLIAGRRFDTWQRRIFGTATDRLVLSRPEMIYSLTNRA